MKLSEKKHIELSILSKKRNIIKNIYCIYALINKDKIVKFIHVMSNAETGEEVATSELIAAHLDRQARKACPIPEEIKERCMASISNAT